MLLVLTPLALERDLLKKSLETSGHSAQLQKTGFVSGFLFEKPRFFLAQGGHGKVQFALQTQHLIHHLPKISGVLCIGAAGSLTESVKAGDIVIAEKTIEHDYNLKFIKKPLPGFDGDSQFLAAAQGAVAALPTITRTNSIHFGFVASGDEDIMDRARAQQIFNATGALAVAWEGAGAARASQFHKLPFLEVRVITDLASDSASSDFKKQIEPGMARLAEFLTQFIPLTTVDKAP